jgi:hypothetical protein
LKEGDVHLTNRSQTAEEVLASLGYADPMDAARQQARMILLGRLARYQALVRQMEAKWRCSLAEMRRQYDAQGRESFEADDDYLQWQWSSDALKSVKTQLATLSRP